MAASANQNNGNNQEGSSNGNGAAANNNGISVPENSVVGPTQAALRHNPGLSVEWTPDEQALLEDLLAKYVILHSLSRYTYLCVFACIIVCVRVKRDEIFVFFLLNWDLLV